MSLWPVPVLLIGVPALSALLIWVSSKRFGSWQ
jgi:hypothetical protein